MRAPTTLALVEFANTFRYHVMMASTVLLTCATLRMVVTIRQSCAMITACVLTMLVTPPMAIALTLQVWILIYF
jgi:hypothetical protein